MSGNEKTADAIVGLHQPLLLFNCINQFIADDLLCAIGDFIHLSYPLHLIYGFKSCLSTLKHFCKEKQAVRNFLLLAQANDCDTDYEGGW